MRDFNKQLNIIEELLVLRQISAQDERRALEKDGEFLADVARDLYRGYDYSAATKTSSIDEILFRVFLDTEVYRKKYYNKDFINSVLTMARKIPKSNGSRFYQADRKTIGIVCDEFLYHSFEGMVNLIYINKANYRQYAEQLDIFLVVTTWKGLDMDWRGLGNLKSNKRKHLYSIISFYKKHRIPVVFFSKEDPVNYEIFVDIAKCCDYVLTTAAEKVTSYQRDCQNQQVQVWSFGINPLYHNPVGIKAFPKEEGVLFAGSWYEKYPDRQVDTRILFDGTLASTHSLHIIDRNFELDLPQYHYPGEYLPYVSPAVKHDDLQQIHKLFHWAINLNSVKYSSTMFANRVYELQAVGNIILSNYSMGIHRKFPHVHLFVNASDVRRFLDAMTPEEIYEEQLTGIRRVMSYETTYHRLLELYEILHLPYKKLERSVLVLVEEETEKIKKMFHQQTYPLKELLTVAEFTEDIKAHHHMIAFFDEANEYGPFYLEDMVNGFKYTDSDYITKDEEVEFDFVSHLKDKCKAIFWASSYTAQELSELGKNTDLANGFSIDARQINEEIHQTPATQWKFSVIVPIFNNGEYLLHKCFSSLKRSSMFQEMEIVLVDDGSTDHRTPHIVRDLERKNANVKVFFYTDGGSGSASRARRQGVELASTDYIAFLNPEDEETNDGYAKLFHEKEDFDAVIGNTINLSDKSEEIQSMLMKKSLLVHMVDADRVRMIDEDVHIHYGT